VCVHTLVSPPECSYRLNLHCCEFVISLGLSLCLRFDAFRSYSVVRTSPSLRCGSSPCREIKVASSQLSTCSTDSSFHCCKLHIAQLLTSLYMTEGIITQGTCRGKFPYNTWEVGNLKVWSLFVSVQPGLCLGVRLVHKVEEMCTNTFVTSCDWSLNSNIVYVPLCVR